jgi:hypothetical protein
MPAKQIKHARMKQKLGEEYLNRTKSILETKLNGKNTIKAIKTYATSVLNFSLGMVKWTPTELENLQTKMRTLLTRYRFHHPRAAKERLTLPRQMGGRLLIDISRLHDKRVKLLQAYFLNKQAISSLHAAVMKADGRCTPLDLVRANANELPRDEEYNNKVRDNGPKKPPSVRSQPTICRHRSVEQMADKSGFVRRNRGIFNSNTGPSHTKKKLQEIYFEAARYRIAMQKMWKRIRDNPTHYCSM